MLWIDETRQSERIARRSQKISEGTGEDGREERRDHDRGSSGGGRHNLFHHFRALVLQLIELVPDIESALKATIALFGETSTHDLRQLARRLV